MFLAAGERTTALVQGLRLPQAERHAGEGLSDEVVADLTKLATRRNESDLIAATLAARSGVERMWSVDDHSDDSPDDSTPAESKAYAGALTKAWGNPATHARQADDERFRKQIAQPGGVLTMYRAMNESAEPLRTYQSDFGAALREPSRQQFDRSYPGYWETRNLRMVANIREVLMQAPGTRMLAIVWASHKGYYEAYLNQMHDVTLVDTASILR